MSEPRILYCHCAYAQIIPKKIKDEVLEKLSSSGRAFDAVSDLCEMSARRDPALARLASGERPVKIAACYPRAVKWLFHAADNPLPDSGIEVRNMRSETADEVVAGLLTDACDHNLPANASPPPKAHPEKEASS